MLKIIFVICLTVLVFIPNSFSQSNNSALLYSQKSLTSNHGISSNTYYPSGIAINYECQAADDFVVPGQWSIDQIVVSGQYSDTYVNADGFNLYVYSDNNNKPDSLLYSAVNQSFSVGGNIFTIPLANPIELVNGHHWISVQAILNWNNNAYEGWIWNEVMESYNIEAEFQNPAWGNGNGGCHSWAPIRSCWTTQGTDMYFELYGSSLVSVEVEVTSPLTFSLEQNYPNPFNPSTTISWQSPVSSNQTLKVYDILGNEVATLVDEYKSAGSYEVEFNASHLPSGTYFYQLRAGSFVETKKMILLK